MKASYRRRHFRASSRELAKNEKTRDAFLGSGADLLDGLVACRLAGQGYQDRGLYAFIHRGLTPIPKSLNPKVPLIGEKQP